MTKNYSLILSIMALLANPISGNDLKGTWRGQSITEFSADENKKLDWRIVNDGVMGGLSEGNIQYTDVGTMIFHGDLSLENNGGFSLVRTAPVQMNLSNDLGLLIRVKGDGRTYQARLTSDARYRGMEVSFSGEFKTEKDKWIEIKLPFTNFPGSFRGRSLPEEKLNPANIQQVGIILADKKQAPFELELEWIRTYGKGQGNKTETKQEKSTATDAPKTEKPASSHPGGANSLIATAVKDGRFTTLKTALDTAGLTTFFQWDNALTIFAPTDAAFAQLPKSVLEDLLKPENKKKLVNILSYHVVAGNHSLPEALKAGSVKTVQGKPLKIAFASGTVSINEAKLIDSDVTCSDGIIHVIDSVLLPE